MIYIDFSKEGSELLRCSCPYCGGDIIYSYGYDKDAGKYHKQYLCYNGDYLRNDYVRVDNVSKVLDKKPVSTAEETIDK